MVLELSLIELIDERTLPLVGQIRDRDLLR